MKSFIFITIVILPLVKEFVLVSSEKLGRGSSCETQRISPKFKQRSDSCDAEKGLECVESENPEFVKDRGSSRICDCTEEYYFDPVSQECRIQIGLPCDPVTANDDQSSWDSKCAQNGFCSTDLGRYGPKNAKGMCRCKDGYYVSSVWFVGGGGTICEKDDTNGEDFKLYRKDPGQFVGVNVEYDDLEMNGLVLEQ